MPWLRLWTTILNDPDVHDLPMATRWGWIALLAAAKENQPEGELPPIRRLVLVVNEETSIVTQWINDLLRVGLLDEEGGVLKIHGWERWQAKVDRTNAKRQADWRKRHSRKSNPPDIPPEEKKRREESRVEVTALRNAVTQSEPPALSVTSVPQTESDTACDMAMRVAGDVSWGPWVLRQIETGHTPKAIMAAIAAALDANKLSMPYVASILRRYATEGVPELKTTSQAAAKAGVRPSWPKVINPKEAS